MKQKIKKLVWAILRIGVCVVALGWVLNSLTYDDYVVLSGGERFRVVKFAEDSVTLLAADGAQRVVQCGAEGCENDAAITIERGMRWTVAQADPQKLLLCLLVFAPVPLIQSWRLRLMLRAQEIDVTYWEVVKLSYAGNFLNFVTPLGSTGGDVFKMYYASLHTDRKTEAAVTILLDRVVGLFGLVLLVACVILVRMGDSKLGMLTYGVGGIVVGIVLAATVLFSERVRATIRPQHLLAKLPFAAQLQRAEAATRRLGQHKRLVLAAVGSALVLQVVAMTSFMIAGLSVGMKGGSDAIWDYYAYLPAGGVVAAIPISPQGLGTMEAFFKQVFLNTHGSLSSILCLAMAIRLITLFWSLPGVIVTLTGAYRPRISEEEVRFA